MIAIDFTKIQDLNCGLGQFSYHLMKEFEQDAAEFEFIINNKKSKIKKNIILVHATHQDSNIFSLIKKYLYVITIHDLNGFHEKKNIRKFFYFIKIQLKILLSSGISYISYATKKDVQKHFYIRSKTLQAVIYNGVNPPRSLAVVPVKNIPLPYFLFIGTIHPKKNLEVLIEMMSYLPDYFLILAGVRISPYTKKLDQLIEKFNLKNRVILTGPVDENTKEYLFQNARAFLFPSLFEGFGLPILESMFRKVPVFCSNISVFQELGKDYVEYFKNFNPSDMADQLSHLSEKYSTQRLEQAQIYAQSFSWQESARRYREFYRNILNRR